MEIAPGFVLEKICAMTADQLTELGFHPDVNELSLVARLRHGSTTALLTGDLNKALGRHLLATVPEALRCEILKVPHHGAESMADNEFFRHAAPVDALVSVPSGIWATERCRRTRDILAELKTRIWVSGVHGHVTVAFHKRGYDILPETPAMSFSEWLRHRMRPMEATDSSGASLKLRANDNATELVIGYATRLDVTLSVCPGPLANTSADWWITCHRNGQDDGYLLDGSMHWLTAVDGTVDTPTYQGPLVPVDTVPVWSSKAGYLPQGEYLFRVVADAPDGVFNPESEWFASGALRVRIK
ncbi:MAG: hypothetical protein ABR497_08225 [Kiritimatiellia bacterium]